MEIVYVYQKKRKEFGKQINFQERHAALKTDIPSDPLLMKNFSIKNPCVSEVLCVPEMSEHEVNTESFVIINQGIQHTEGGWPKDVDPTDIEHTIRYRKKVEKDEDYMRSVKVMGDSVEHCIKQNNAIDIYEEYFEVAINDINVEPPTAKTLNVYRDPSPVKRSAACVSWYPEEGNKIAVAYSILEFQKSPPNMCTDSYIWDVEHPNKPDQTLTPSSPLVSLKYNPKDPHILVGGAYNGIVAYWDTRKGAFPVDASPVEKSHQDPVFGLAWVQSKTGSEFFSASTDGQVLWWDIRKLSEPTESLIMDPEKNNNPVGITVLDFETTMPTKFMAGAENGSIFLCNKKAKSPSDKIAHTYVGHHGPVYALQRNPFFPKNFLTVGDWSAKLWSEDVRSPIMSTKYHTAYLTSGCWSPVRPAVFFTSKMDGTMDIWDFVFKQNEPALTVQISDCNLLSLKVQDHGKHVAVGGADGSTTLIEISGGLSRLQQNEKAIFSSMLEREAKREKATETAARERRLRMQKRPNSSVQHKDSEFTMDELIQKAEEDFFQVTSSEPDQVISNNKR